MAASLRHLLANVFDYAGLFPPTQLAMADAASNFGRYLNGPEEWVVNRFVCPVDRLGELQGFLPRGQVWPIAALGTSIESLRDDLRLIASFETSADGRAMVECYEVRAETGVSPSQLKSLGNAGFEEAFVELPWNASLVDGLHSLAETDELGAKARTGGIEASAYPSPELLSTFLQECIHLDLPMKMTAGLHHPTRFMDPTIDGMSHGFLNVLCAGILAADHDLSRAEIAEVLSETDHLAFKFDEEVLRWREIESEIEDIDDFREIFRSIGSCEIEVSLTDLDRIGLSPEAMAR